MAIANLQTHRNWLGLIDKEGIVLSPVALDEAGVVLAEDVRTEQRALKEQHWDEVREALFDVWEFLKAKREVGGLYWPAGWLTKFEQLAEPDRFALQLPGSDVVLKPSAVLCKDADTQSRPILLVQVYDDTLLRLDGAVDRGEDGWTATPTERFEKLLRGNAAEVRVGVLVTPRALRLVYAPPGQMSGHLTWRFADLLETAGRPMLSALYEVLEGHWLIQHDGVRDLRRVLERSREAQNAVTTELSLQVLDGLRALLAALDTADQQAGGALLRGVKPGDLYQALLHVLLRLVFLLFAEERQLLPQDEVWLKGYGLRALFDRLRDDAALHPDSLTLRYGAWARLLATFRMVHDGGAWPGQRMPPRAGVLFNPDNWPFLEGRPHGVARQLGALIAPPNVSDAAVLQVLQGLLVVHGEALSYRTLDVEHIGSVYEGMMGFTVEVAEQRSALVGKLGVPVALGPLLAMTPARRVATVEESAQRMPAPVRTALQNARSDAEIEQAILPLCRVSGARVVDAGGRYLMPTEERRRTGSHYTPRSLSAPIVQKTLEPLLADLGASPRAAQILALKICDPAVGSGAFLVEACRQLAEQVVAAWERHGDMPRIPLDEEPLLYARRLVAEKCLYGVDRNPVALDLAKLSLWLVTLAKDHDFAFVNHALKWGDSLVGLSKKQIEAFTWGEVKEVEGFGLFAALPDKRVETAAVLRQQIQAWGDDAGYAKKDAVLREASDGLLPLQVRGDLIVAAFFAGSKDAERLRELARLRRVADGIADGKVRLLEGLDVARGLLEAERPVVPFHWELEFPEVFERGNPGFDGFVGNPPFAGKNNLIAGNAEGYVDWLKVIHEGAHGNADLVAHFFRRAFALLRRSGAFGLIATNTIGQGDTRATRLRAICHASGTIYAATRRVKWPGLAAVVVSVVHVRKGAVRGRVVLDGREVDRISAFLFHAGGDDDPVALAANSGKSFQGSNILGAGFTFDDNNPDANTLDEMRQLVLVNSRNSERIHPLLGGDELNSSPTHSHHRYVMNLGDLSEAEAWSSWPDLMRIAERKVRPARLAQNREIRSRYWWRFGETTPALFAALRGLRRVLAVSQVTQFLSFAFVNSDQVFSHALYLIALPEWAGFCLLQSTGHDLWARFFGSSLEDRLRYAATDCFETFPFPPSWQTNPELESIGETYYTYRADLMLRNNQGLTATYNRFHNPDETDPAILHLRDLHTQMDRAVLQAYGWGDIPTECGFFHVHEGIAWDERDAENPEHRSRNFRYTWPAAVRDEVLARLLALNAVRAGEEAKVAGVGKKGGRR